MPSFRPPLVLLLTRTPAWVYRRPNIAGFQQLHCPDGRVLRRLGSRWRGAGLGDRTRSRNTSSSRGSRRRRTPGLALRHARPERAVLFRRCLVAKNASHDRAHQAKDESNDGHGKGRTRGEVDRVDTGIVGDIIQRILDWVGSTAVRSNRREGGRHVGRDQGQGTNQFSFLDGHQMDRIGT
ncbi:unnamed protein product [Ectocarpus sp. 13 AM-2016]